MLKTILACLFFGLGLLTITFFENYSGNVIPYPFVFWLVGLIFFRVGLYFLNNKPANKELQEQNRMRAFVDDLKANGEQIPVDFAKCEVKENSYFEERERYGSDNDLVTFGFGSEVQAWNAIGGDAVKNVENVAVNQSVVSYYHNEERFISRIISKDKTTLAMYLAQQKQTKIYVDKTDRKRYYFDLEFLNK